MARLCGRYSEVTRLMADKAQLLVWIVGGLPFAIAAFTRRVSREQFDAARDAAVSLRCQADRLFRIHGATARAVALLRRVRITAA